MAAEAAMLKQTKPKQPAVESAPSGHPNALPLEQRVARYNHPEDSCLVV